MTVGLNLVCLKCGQLGVVFLDGQEPFATGDGFYLRINRHGGSPDIVCDGCGRIHTLSRAGMRLDRPARSMAAPLLTSQ